MRGQSCTALNRTLVALPSPPAPLTLPAQLALLAAPAVAAEAVGQTDEEFVESLIYWGITAVIYLFVAPVSTIACNASTLLVSAAALGSAAASYEQFVESLNYWGITAVIYLFVAPVRAAALVGVSALVSAAAPLLPGR
ncbi:unnamed protein product [Closterium sp. NIES-54]